MGGVEHATTTHGKRWTAKRKEEAASVETKKHTQPIDQTAVLEISPRSPEHSSL